VVQLKGGDKLDAALKKMSAAVKKAAVLTVGFMGNATEPDGTPVAFVAAMNEFGHGNVPPRPFFRRTIKKRGNAWGHNLGVALVRSGYDAKKALTMMGVGIRDDVQDGIRELVSPPLKESTIKRKGFDKPLIETSTMLNSVTFKVK